jgi:hypothetical protein
VENSEWNDYLNTAHAFLVAQLNEDAEAITLLEDTFIKPQIDEGHALDMVGAFSTVAVYTVAAVCRTVGWDAREVLGLANMAKEIVMQGNGYICMVCGHYQEDGFQCEICMSLDLKKV